MKKAQGLPIQVIILLILGVIILVIVLALITQRTTIFGKGLKNISEEKCPADQIRDIGDPNCKEVIYGSFVNLGPNQVCCKISKNENQQKG